jgi:hypothetical protein
VADVADEVQAIIESQTTELNSASCYTAPDSDTDR